MGIQEPDQYISIQREMSTFLQDNSLLISSPKSLVTLLTLDLKQDKNHMWIIVTDSEVTLSGRC